MFDLSIIIPAYNESKKIREDIDSAVKFLTDHDLLGEIIIVDDGSRDGTAFVAEKVEVPASVYKNVIQYTTNRGKGHAVRVGMSQSKGNVVMFTDSGSCFDYINVKAGYDLIKAGECDIAHGSRWLQESNVIAHQRLLRRIASRVYRWIVFSFMDIPRHFTDTQCGLKVFRGQVAQELFEHATINGYSFDIEIILRAINKEFLIKEFPVQCRHDLDSRQPTFSGLFQIFGDLVRIKRLVPKTIFRPSQHLIRK